ncbi:hypothetical protein FGB62_2g140 [Gracilaria domingensis]|nr:hypothetical protein FGB62_2g140 [Gracilaria domingensis]
MSGRWLDVSRSELENTGGTTNVFIGPHAPRRTQASRIPASDCDLLRCGGQPPQITAARCPCSQICNKWAVRSPTPGRTGPAVYIIQYLFDRRHALIFWIKDLEHAVRVHRDCFRFFSNPQALSLWLGSEQQHEARELPRQVTKRDRHSRAQEWIHCPWHRNWRRSQHEYPPQGRHSSRTRAQPLQIAGPFRPRFNCSLRYSPGLARSRRSFS